MLLLPFKLPGALREFLGVQMTVSEAELALRDALETREERFLEIARSQIYERPGSPYLRLLEHASCALGDLEDEVRRRGLEATLERLAAGGVYLTDAESKGRKEVVRGSLQFHVSPRSIESASSRAGLVMESSGSSGAATRAVGEFRWLASEAVVVGVFLSAHRLLGSALAAFEPIVPGAPGVQFLLQAARFGIRTERWFGRVVPSHTRLQRAYYRSVACELAAVCRLSGRRFPVPRLVDPADPRPIIDWITDVRRTGREACVRTVASNAARIARRALELGAKLDGTTFVASGEPLTDAKRRAMDEAGARVTVQYGFNPGTHVGFGCAAPLHIDEMHVNEQSLAVIEHPSPIKGGERPIRPLLFTTLYPFSARLQLNVANGDYAVVERRDCGCALGRAGLSMHIHRVRSFEKLASEGMNYMFEDLAEALEETLPSQFGGGPGDYQLVEEEDAGGQSRLTLLIHPDVGNVDELQALACLQEALEEGGPVPRYMARAWQQYGTLRLRREAPRASSRGKVLPLHIER
jgi:hypothetical protein